MTADVKYCFEDQDIDDVARNMGDIQVRRELEPPEPLEGWIYDLPDEQLGGHLPGTFQEALEALKADPVIVEAMGEKLVGTFETIKAAELERFRAWVTDWEFAEYSHRL